MENRITYFAAILLLIGLLPVSCLKDADIPGMVIHDDQVNMRFDHSMEWNKNNTPREIMLLRDDYTILCMSDSHVGGTENLTVFLDSAMIKGVAAIVMAGDLSTGHKEDVQRFKQHMPGQEILPSFPIAGNHDLYFGGWEHFYSIFGSSTYYFTVNTFEAADLFICLDTGGGTLGNKQLDWFRDVLVSIRPGYRNCIVITHNNLFRFRRTTSTNPLPEELHVWLDLFLRHRVNMVITGHDHKKDEQVFGNTTHIIMDALKDGEKNAGYFQLHVKNGKLQYSFVTI